MNQGQIGSSPDQTRAIELRYRWLFDWASPWEYTAHAIKREIYCATSNYQRIEIVETEGYGRCLILNGEVQSFECDEYIYHESLVHPAMIAHSDPRRVLVIGGGEGATIREVIRHRSVEQAIMVDIDEQLIAASRQYLPSFHQGAFDDSRVSIHFADGREFIERCSDQFDLIVIDVTNPIQGGPSFRLFTVEFYRAVRARLRPGGLVVLQSSCVTLGSLDSAATIYQTVQAAWPHVRGCAVFLPAYTTDWSFTIAGCEPLNLLDGSAATIDERIRQRLAQPLRYYDGIAHQRMCHLPRYVREAFDQPRAISRDDRPIQEALPGLMRSDEVNEVA
jgi:spermidine synthase